ncbi:MAG: hypothetical protein KatS3mg003_1606 [Candidatus Nitrosocaldaceae archaeon]|nr:MAG: hypothetical protein KatS3mg003_0461 [Candidatus Nitrosocaldaceae archaeon]GIU72127.1 MAG: hypothetical protein KatS3mg003_1606 [Candidatus Nitrosocaldaceae archaeon]
MKAWIGTSGYTYDWNKAKPSAFEWYLMQGFNSVEINASFYRFPSKNWMKAWSKAPSSFRFAIKVHRSITHYARLRGRAVELFNKFADILKPMDYRIRFWLFQMPPSFIYSDDNLKIVKEFASMFDDDRFVIEFRDPSWWQYADKINEFAIFCSVDAPDLPRDIIASNNKVYLRLHGRYIWYSYLYEENELDEIIDNINNLGLEEVAIYLNNDHGMLANGLYLLERFKNYL